MTHTTTISHTPAHKFSSRPSHTNLSALGSNGFDVNELTERLLANQSADWSQGPRIFECPSKPDPSVVAADPSRASHASSSSRPSPPAPSGVDSVQSAWRPNMRIPFIEVSHCDGGTAAGFAASTGLHEREQGKRPTFRKSVTSDYTRSSHPSTAEELFLCGDNHTCPPESECTCERALNPELGTRKSHRQQVFYARKPDFRLHHQTRAVDADDDGEDGLVMAPSRRQRAAGGAALVH